MRTIVLFDPDDINGAIAELTARRIASGEVEHPEVIEVNRRLYEAVNRHDWDAIEIQIGGGTYINHRQLAADQTSTIADHLPSTRMLASLVPNVWIELAEILAHSASGVLAHLVVKGTSTVGVAIEIWFLQLTLLEGDHMTHIESFDPAQRDLALARFEELNQSG